MDLHKNACLKILFLFLLSKVVYVFFVYLGREFFDINISFLGGGIANFSKNPYFWSLLNFDGEHYLSIARNGYLPLTYFFFPLYPLLVLIVSKLFGGSYFVYVLVGLIISNTFFLLSLIGLYRLLKLDYSEKITWGVICLLLLFPTSFYLGAYYTESLFLALCVWGFYFIRRNDLIIAGLTSALLTATRLVGIALAPAILAEAYSLHHTRQKKIELGKLLGSMLISPLGIFIYMLFLRVKAGDPLAFFHNISIFGDQRSNSLVVLPQVFYRYIFKVLPNINYSCFPVVFTTLLEIVIALLFLVILIYSYKNLRLSYFIYFLFGYLIPPLSGSFSSLPRYVLVLFPAFICFSTLLSKLPRVLQLSVFCVLFILQGIAIMLFSRGYFVS